MINDHPTVVIDHLILRYDNIFGADFLTNVAFTLIMITFFYAEWSMTFPFTTYPIFLLICLALPHLTLNTNTIVLKMPVSTAIKYGWIFPQTIKEVGKVYLFLQRLKMGSLKRYQQVSYGLKTKSINLVSVVWKEARV